MIVTIDGTAGVGKGTLAEGIVKKYNFKFLDTGALFRTVAYFLLQDQSLTEDNIEIKAIFYSKNLNIEFTKDFKLISNGIDITKEIRTPEAGDMASKIAVILEVRENLNQFQKHFAEKYRSKGVILDGRDIGTFVCPDAPVKFFLDCPAEVRAKRRVEQLKDMNIKSNYNDILKGIQERDHRDRNRKIRPLKPAKDAIIIDTSINSIENVLKIASKKIDLELTQKGL